MGYSGFRACGQDGMPLLIKRFVDPDAEFLFVPRIEVKAVAEREGAIPYDLDIAELKHYGKNCTFDAIIEKYEIKDEAVLELAKIVRAADTGRANKVPQARGFEFLLDGISMASKNDDEAIEKTMVVYDHFYDACRLKLFREKHAKELQSMDKRTRRSYLREHLASGKSSAP
ncbi:MAG: chromate resistance protein ChrB domain-containing protein [Promethearchaeota archaeon]